MGRVVEATDTLLGRRVAVKEALTDDPELLRRFARETKITAKLEHPSIVPLYDAGVVDGQPYYVMRRVTGRPLAELIREATALDKRLALLPHVLAAARAIAHAHRRGIIHRDIKPANILVGELGETVVIDWGLAKVIDEPDDEPRIDAGESGTSLRTRVGTVFGTPGFMAPEQLRGEPGGTQTDVYALGASLYHLLAAEPPHYSDDSTKMMALAAQAPPRSISELVPGVPPELSTIVDTALHYDTAQRYRDAAAFVEDLEHFLAGQLVASHRYSRTEHVLRFVRRHRAAVGIASAAAIVVVAIGAFAIWRVIGERDRADAQARLAEQGRHDAEAARAMADERAEQLLLARARALVDSNPTAALASLHQLPPASKLAGEAIAIAHAARVRGVAWALRGPDARTAAVQLDPTGRLLAQMTVTGDLHVWDLEARQQRYRRDVGRGSQIAWIRGGAQLVVFGVGPTMVLDGAGITVAHDLPALTCIDADDRGLVLAAIDDQRRALRIDLASDTAIHLADEAEYCAIAPAGTWIAASTPTSVVVFDRANRQITRHATARTVARIAASDDAIAVVDDARVLELRPAVAPRFVELRAHDPYRRPIDVGYLHDRAYILDSSGRVLSHAHVGLVEIGRATSLSPTLSPVGTDYLLIGAESRSVHLVAAERGIIRTLQLPIALRSVRMVSRAGIPRAIAIGDGAIVVLELGFFPRIIQREQPQAVFATNDIAIAAKSPTWYLAWHRLDRAESQTIDLSRAHDFVHVERQSGRVGARELGSNHFVQLLPFDATRHVFREAHDTIALVEGGGLLYTRGERVYGGRAAPYRELFTTAGPATLLQRLPAGEVLVVTERELVRAHVETGVIARVPLPPGPAVTHTGALGRVPLVARRDRLYAWRSGLDEVARFTSPVELLQGTVAGTAVTLEDGSTMFVAPDGTTSRVSSSRGSILVSETRLVVPGPSYYEVIELPSLARWEVPIPRAHSITDAFLDLAPNGARLLESRAPRGGTWLWTLPERTELATALAATNFIEDANGLLLWPWQRP